MVGREGRVGHAARDAVDQGDQFAAAGHRRREFATITSFISPCGPGHIITLTRATRRPSPLSTKSIDVPRKLGQPLVLLDAPKFHGAAEPRAERIPTGRTSRWSPSGRKATFWPDRRVSPAVCRRPRCNTCTGPLGSAAAIACRRCSRAIDGIDAQSPCATSAGLPSCGGKATATRCSAGPPGTGPKRLPRSRGRRPPRRARPKGSGSCTTRGGPSASVRFRPSQLALAGAFFFIGDDQLRVLFAQGPVGLPLLHGDGRNPQQGHQRGGDDRRGERLMLAHPALRPRRPRLPPGGDGIVGQPVLQVGGQFQGRAVAIGRIEPHGLQANGFQGRGQRRRGPGWDGENRRASRGRTIGGAPCRQRAACRPGSCRAWPPARKCRCGGRS